jgi:hypothetical protein
MAAAERMNVKSANKDETVPLIPFDVKPKRKDVTAEQNSNVGVDGRTKRCL